MARQHPRGVRSRILPSTTVPDEAPQAGEHRPLLLLVDDEPVGLRSLASMFSDVEYELTFASSGFEAISKVEESTPDLVLLDVMMPGIDGLETCRRIRALPGVAEVPILLVTALDDRESRLEGLSSGADDYITKPFDRAEVRARVRTVTRLNRFRKLQAEIIHSRQAMSDLAANSALQDGLRRIDKAILQASSSQEIAAAVLPLLRDLIPHEHAAIYRCDPRGQPNVLLSEHGHRVPLLAGLPGPRAKDLGLELRAGAEEPQSAVLPLPGGVPLPAVMEGFRASGASDLLVVPLRLKGRSFGVLLLGFAAGISAAGPRAEVVREIADILSLALAHSESLETVTRGRSQLEFLSRRLLQVREEESRHIARELHDEIGQFLAVLNFSLRGMQQSECSESVRETLGYCLDVVERLLSKVRGLSLDLHPSLLEDFGLVTALRRYIGSVVSRIGLAVILEADESIDRFDRGLETACYRVIQEALTNALRHGKANRVRIELAEREGALHLLVEDDGRGFDPDAAMERAARGGSLGLLGMRERISLVGGELSILSEPGAGTQIRATFPLAHSTPADEFQEA
ncbi:ATP-binding response regulator [Aquisphaera insulae]|uniref:ATP-binding response regulator n=1 Tax=Aquisphaera insulae TaxID=2712864 RepID=UPI0013EB1FD2|nr:response regulator [Aquisphaera insulae]